MECVIARYLIEIPLAAAQVVALLAGEQSSGTLVAVQDETAVLKKCSTASEVGRHNGCMTSGLSEALAISRCWTQTVSSSPQMDIFGSLVANLRRRHPTEAYSWREKTLS